MTDPSFHSAVALLAALREGELSSRELLEHYLSRIAREGAALNAVVTLDAERARERADAADAARARGESWGPLHGLPMTVKDTFETAGLRTTAGTPQLAEHVPERDAVAVARLRAAGAVVFGKTNTPAWAMDWQTTNELFGTTNNPWDAGRSPGGSSGGSAAALAAGLTGLELGSDIGGSIRIPAHCCGVFGHKPSYGLVPQRGHVPGPPGSRVDADINVVGPLARGVADLELALAVLAGPLPEDAVAWRLELPPPRRARLSEWRVAAWLDEPGLPVDARVREVLEAAVETLRGAGARVDERARPAVGLAEALELYRQLLPPATSSTLPEAHFEQLVAGAGGSGEPADDPRGHFARALGMRHRRWLALHEERQRMRSAWADFFRDVDLLLCPVMPVPAIPHDHSEPMPLRTIEVDGRPRPYLDHFVWSGTLGVCYLPATVVPAGRSPEGLPVGLQIVAPFLEDRSALAFAAEASERLGGFRPPPGFDAPRELR